jgi:hypothetical protein
MPGREAEHSPPSAARVKNAWRYTYSPQYIFMALCSVKAQEQIQLHHVFYAIQTSLKLNLAPFKFCREAFIDITLFCRSYPLLKNREIRHLGNYNWQRNSETSRQISPPILICLPKLHIDPFVFEPEFRC